MMPIFHSSQNLPAEVRLLEEENRSREKIPATAANKPARVSHPLHLRAGLSRARNLLPPLLMPPARSPPLPPCPKRKGVAVYGTVKLASFGDSRRQCRCSCRFCFRGLCRP